MELTCVQSVGVEGLCLFVFFNERFQEFVAAIDCGISDEKRVIVISILLILSDQSLKYRATIGVLDSQDHGWLCFDLSFVHAHLH